jgi:hypothetical protein
MNKAIKAIRVILILILRNNNIVFFIIKEFSLDYFFWNYEK